MKLSNRSITLFSIMMLLIILLPAITGLVGLTVENEFPEDDDYTLANSFMASWARMPIHQLLSGLMLGMSMFTLFVVYLGGRSNHRRFNDRTLDSFNFFGVFFFATALFRAVFVFLFFPYHPGNGMGVSFQSCFPRGRKYNRPQLILNRILKKDFSIITMTD